MSLTVLPVELLREIFQYSEDYKAVLKQVCKSYRWIIGNRRFKIPRHIALFSPELLSWAIMNKYKISFEDLCVVVRLGYISMAKKIIEIRNYLTKYNAYKFCEEAIEHDQIPILKALRDGSLGSVCPWRPYTLVVAVECNRIDIIELLRDSSLGGRCPLSAHAMRSAVTGGNLQIVSLLRSGELGEVCRWNKQICRKLAIKNSQPHILEAIDSGDIS